MHTVHTIKIHTHAAAVLTAMEECTFISEVIGAAVSKLKENIQ